jgi:hypothetical protein
MNRPASRTLLCIAFAWIGIAQAQPAPAQRPEQQAPGGGHRRPPPPAIDACKGKKAGDKASFTGRRGEKVEGSCRQIDDVLAVVPAGGPPHDHEGQGPGGKPPADQSKK